MGAKRSRWWLILCVLMVLNIVTALSLSSAIQRGWVSSLTATPDRPYDVKYRGGEHYYVSTPLGIYNICSIPISGVLLLLAAIESRRAHRKLARDTAQELR
jgi:hypothetical protein